MFTYGYGYVLRRCDPCYTFASVCMIFFCISQLVSSSFVCVAFSHALTVSIEEMSQDCWRKRYTPCFCFVFVILAIHACLAPSLLTFFLFCSNLIPPFALLHLARYLVVGCWVGPGQAIHVRRYPHLYLYLYIPTAVLFIFVFTLSLFPIHITFT